MVRFIYESFLRKFDGDSEFDRIRESIELRSVKIETVNHIIKVCYKT